MIIFFCAIAVLCIALPLPRATVPRDALALRRRQRLAFAVLISVVPAIATPLIALLFHCLAARNLCNALHYSSLLGLAFALLRIALPGHAFELFRAARPSHRFPAHCRCCASPSDALPFPRRAEHGAATPRSRYAAFFVFFGFSSSAFNISYSNRPQPLFLHCPRPLMRPYSNHSLTAAT